MNTKLRNMTAVYIRRGNEMLMLYRVGSKVVAPSWCGVGGHFEKDELNDPQACVLRELEEETGLTAGDINHLRLRYVTMRLKNGEIRQNYYFFAELNPEIHFSGECTEGELRWVPISQLAEMNMPHSAKHVILHYLSEGHNTDCIYGGVSCENGTDFTVLREY